MLTSRSDFVKEEPNQGLDTVFTSVDYRMRNNLETLILTGNKKITGYGNNANNTLIGNNVTNKLDGQKGNDWLEGNEGNDILDGDIGRDTMSGGLGNDTYYIDNQDDLIIEKPDEGLDKVNSSVDYTLPSNFEDLTLQGTDNLNGLGNSLDNRIKGNKADNLISTYEGQDFLMTLDGNDTIDGGIDVDRMIGGRGDDLYYVDETNDLVVERSDQGTDTVISSASYRLRDHIEKLVLTGNNNINGSGSSYNEEIIGNDKNNYLSGNNGDDTLIGNKGNDTLKGGQGDDQLFLGTNDGFVDTVEYKVDEGQDTIFDFETGIDLLYFKRIPFIDVQVVGDDTNLFIGNGIAEDNNFATGSLLATLVDVNDLNSSHLGVEGSSLASANSASFFFS